MWFLLFFFAFFFSLKNLKLHDNKTFFNRLLRLFPFYTPWKHQKTYAVPFLYQPTPTPPKTSENLPFSVFWGYKKGTPGSNGSPDHNLQIRYLQNSTLREECPYSEIFWSVFFRIRTEFGGILRISSYSVRMRVNVDRKNSKYGHFLRSSTLSFISSKLYSHRFCQQIIQLAQVHYCRSSHPEVFCKKNVLVNFARFTGKHLCQSLYGKSVDYQVYDNTDMLNI